MSKEKYILSEDVTSLLGADECQVYEKKDLLELMKEEDVPKIKISKALPSKGYEGEFYCRKYDETYFNCPSDESPCGKDCRNYIPRNGKSGRCKYHRSCYSYGGKSYDLFIDGKMEEIKK